MPRSLLLVVVLVLAISLLSALYACLRGAALAPEEQIEAQGLAAARRSAAILYGAVGIGVGVIAFFVFRMMAGAYPDLAQSRFLLLAVGIGVLLEIAGAIVFKLRGIADLTVVHLLHIAGYGWFLPLIIPR